MPSVLPACFRRPMTSCRVALVAAAIGMGAILPAEANRETLPLDGAWQVAQSVEGEAVPTAFPGTIPVPSYIDLAKPAFQGVGKPSPERKYFWYRRTFTAPADAKDFAVLMIRKAAYGTAVWINGVGLGEQFPCFTPTYWDLRPHLKPGAENELVVRVGATRENIPVGMPGGSDFERRNYIPGIYDSVEIQFSNAPRIVNIQAVPDLAASRVRLLVELQAGATTANATLNAEVVEAADGKPVSASSARALDIPAGGTQVMDITLPIPQARLWSPKEPFLYEARFTTNGDSATVRFGMRSFYFEPSTKLAVLNGQPRYLLGTNIAFHRFVEDQKRGSLPWNRDWVRKMFREFKGMNWELVRTHLGFPPDFWYDIADEEGVMIQDEFPIWTMDPNNKWFNPEKLEARHVVPQMRDWMRHRWNHASVVMWDAQNESDMDEPSLALSAVRYLDYSNRPWDGGWGVPQSLYDTTESHPYKFQKNATKKEGEIFRLSDMPNEKNMPWLKERQRKPVVPIMVNEYDWLWINRDGSPANLSRRIYQVMLGENSTPEQNRVFRARTTAALTEFWRTHRNLAGVLHFVGLGYSLPGPGQTCDDWIDLENLVLEPNFKKYMGMAFAPVALMLDYWAETAAPGSKVETKVYVINDRSEPWKGEVAVRVEGESAPLATATAEIPPLGRVILPVSFTLPNREGKITLSAELRDGDATIQSLRDVTLGAAPTAAAAP